LLIHQGVTLNLSTWHGGCSVENVFNRSRNEHDPAQRSSRLRRNLLVVPRPGRPPCIGAISQSGPTAQPAAGAQAQQFGEEKLESFAESLGEIMEIREEFTGKLQQTEDADKARDLQQQANEKMLGVIEENDISIDEYNAINQAVQTDPELRNRVIAMMQQ